MMCPVTWQILVPSLSLLNWPSPEKDPSSRLSLAAVCCGAGDTHDEWRETHTGLSTRSSRPISWTEVRYFRAYGYPKVTDVSRLCLSKVSGRQATARVPCARGHDAEGAWPNGVKARAGEWDVLGCVSLYETAFYQTAEATRELTDSPLQVNGSSWLTEHYIKS